MQLTPAQLQPGDVIEAKGRRATVVAVDLPTGGAVVARIVCLGGADWWAGVEALLDVRRP